MPGRGTETEFELTTIERLELLGYEHIHGTELDRPFDEVVLIDRLRRHLKEQYRELPTAAIETAARRFSRPEGADTIRRNFAFHEMVTKGIDDLRVDWPDGRTEYRHLHAIDWDSPENNEFLVVNQLTLLGQNERRPDIVIYVNGLPLAVFELKNPYAQDPTVDDAINQIHHYRHEISLLFEFNALCVVSDGMTTLHGMWTAGQEWYAPWKSIDGVNVEANTTGSMKTLIEGLFSKDRLLSYIRDFIAFEVVNDVITKKGAKYHQFFAVRIAVQKTADTVTAGADRRIGVIWHTTGSGKSLSMVFLVRILRRQSVLSNPTFVIQVDRNDLDNQLHDQFVAVRSLVGDVDHADSVEDLRRRLQVEAGGIIFTTIEKFTLKRDASGHTLEIEHPVLSDRSNIIVVADEAHRSQYGFSQGHARYLADALPNSRRIGFTGTPISMSGADTVEVFGDLIHVYDIKQSQEDHATVPIYYTPRQVKLHLSKEDVDNALQEIVDEYPSDDVERRRTQWAALAKAAGAKERLEVLARDLLTHFNDRTTTLEGKAMAVCMTRDNAVRLYNELTVLPECPEVKVVMTGNLAKDPEEWSKAGHLTTKVQRESIKERMKDIEDPLKIVIVVDMWLTGTDIPCLHTLYVDKPMKGHNMIQAISRVNRVFRDKPHGLIVDYIGIGEELRDATGQYSGGGGRGEPAPDVGEEARGIFFDELQAVRKLLPAGTDYGDWRTLSRIEFEDRYAHVTGFLLEDEEVEKQFLNAEARLSKAFLLVSRLDDCRAKADEVIFFQQVRQGINKAKPGTQTRHEELEHAVRDLVDTAIGTDGVVDIFAVAGLEKPDISILDDDFLQTFKDRPHQNLRLKLLEKLIRDEIYYRAAKNLAKAKGFKELLEETLKKYHNRLIDAASVIQAMIKIRQEMEDADKRAKELGFTEDELAFYEAVAGNYGNIYDNELLSAVVHEVVATIKKNLKVDWTKPHRVQARAAIRAAVKRVLRKKKLKAEDFDEFLNRFMEQAEAMWADWPTAA